MRQSLPSPTSILRRNVALFHISAPPSQWNSPLAAIECSCSREAHAQPNRESSEARRSHLCTFQTLLVRERSLQDEGSTAQCWKAQRCGISGEESSCLQVELCVQSRIGHRDTELHKAAQRPGLPRPRTL